jgi:hypothetical protein
MLVHRLHLLPGSIDVVLWTVETAQRPLIGCSLHSGEEESLPSLSLLLCSVLLLGTWRFFGVLLIYQAK